MAFIKERPTFSVITVVFNGINEIRDTLNSCIAQDYGNFEYIVIDGGSTDGTQEVLKANFNHITQLVCEKDGGIYDAMNKGLRFASGIYVLFMNCSDQFHDSTVLSQIASILSEEENLPDVLYGDSLYIYPNVKLLTKPKPLEALKREMVFCHQSAFVRTEIAKKYPFNLKYKLAADYDMFHTFFQMQFTFKYVPVCISDCKQEEGSTYNHYRLSTKERFSIHFDQGGLNNWFILQKTLFRLDIVYLIKKVLPKKITSAIFKKRHSNRLISE